MTAEIEKAALTEAAPEATKPALAPKGKKAKPAPEAVTKVGPCKRVHQIADAMKGKTRKEVVDACETEGINRGTARTQTGHWAKANGWTWPVAEDRADV